jgi:cytochrome P450
MASLSQSPTDPAFVQNPYGFYRQAQRHGDISFWEDYGMPAAFSHRAVSALLKDRRFGREIPVEMLTQPPALLAPFYAVEAHSMLELEPPRHTRLRGLVLRAFTSRRIKQLAPEITQLCHDFLTATPITPGKLAEPFDLIAQFANKLPVIVIARLLGVPDSMADQLLAWSNAMVAMYQGRRDAEIEARAVCAAQDFVAFMRDYIKARRSQPQDDLITHLIAAEEDGEKLSIDELITTCILLLNAGHEATVHSLGNGVKVLLESETPRTALTPDTIADTVEEILRFDPPLQLFTRYAYEDVTVFGYEFKRGDQVALMLASANRDPAVWADPDVFNPRRDRKVNTAFGGGIHFCVGAALARLELRLALPILFEHCPALRLAEPPRYANLYHFHGLERLMIAK